MTKEESRDLVKKYCLNLNQSMPEEYSPAEMMAALWVIIISVYEESRLPTPDFKDFIQIAVQAWAGYSTSHEISSLIILGMGSDTPGTVEKGKDA